MNTARFKLLVAGDEAVGKTSLIRRYVNNTFNESYKATLGFEISVKNVVVENYQLILSIWDIGGQNAFKALRKDYYQNTQGFLLAFSINNEDTFDHLTRWYTEIQEVCPKAPLVLVATKTDLSPHEIKSEDIAKKRNELNAPELIMTSAKTGAGVETAFNLLCKTIINSLKSQKK